MSRTYRQYPNVFAAKSFLTTVFTFFNWEILIISR